MNRSKQAKGLHAALTGHRLAGFAVSLFASALLFMCCCGPMCAEAALRETEAPAQGGCCSSHPAPAENPDNGNDGGCECGVACSQHIYVAADGYPVLPMPELALLEPILFKDAPGFAPPTRRLCGTVDLSRAPPAYLRFQMLLI